MKIEMYEDTASEWRWRLKADNGKIVAVGGEGFVTKYTCRESIVSMNEGLIAIYDAGEGVEIVEI